MRLFYALPVPGDIGRQLHDAGDSLKRRCRTLAVPREAGMHFTLFFFGEVDEAGAARLAELLTASALDRPAIRARFSAVGTFPPAGNPRVVYAALGEGESEILRLYADLRRLLEQARWTLEREERDFRPHLTIGRNKGDRLDREELARTALPREGFLIDRCVLFQSLLKPDGAVYISRREHLFSK